ncbi:MAG: hypothetical protein QOF40_1410 [Actinomycetota bacterium]|jgi:hypothetical protein|nr:hypothetical protein [Actinomycetota bacterium]
MTGVDVDAVVTTAADLAGVTDPDPDTFRPNLELLVTSINEEAGLLPEAVAGTQAMLVHALRNRIEVSHWARTHPAIEDEVIDRPLFLTGLPRSGTTYSQYLFDRDPSVRMLRTWEGERPCPPPAFDPESARRRRDASAEQARKMQEDAVHAAIAKIHLMDVDGPQECLAILDQTFGNAGMYWSHRVPTYFDRLLDTIDLRACYRHHKLELQLLQWQATPKQWVLKWPCHLLALEEILAVYPDARFIVTHRDPVQALASNCSLAYLLRTNSSERADRHEIGQQMKNMILGYLRRLVAFDELHGDGATIAHVGYQHVVDEPEVAMTQVFETLGLEMTPAVRESIAEWRRDNPPGKRGLHEYALEEYGLDAGLVAEEYGFYIDRFRIPREGAAST